MILIPILFYALGMWILYFVVKAAVREGILEADRRRFGNNLYHPHPSPKTILCKSCKHEYHRDWVRCPQCLYDRDLNEEEN